MRDDIREYARIGLAHHLLHPKCVANPAYHAKTLEEFVRRGDIETLDCRIPYGDENRRRAITAVKGCCKEVVYAMHLFPLYKISFASICPQEQGLARLVVKDQVDP